MLQRGRGAAFMPGVWVFAGGVVDPGDFEAAASPPAGLDPDEWAHRICGARELGEEGGIELPASELRAWSRWITPEPVPRRFDTRFYVALAPAHSSPVADGFEMDQALWISAADALAAAKKAEMDISFPTIHHLNELDRLGDAGAVVEASEERIVEPILPKAVGTRASFRVLLPGDPDYPE